MPLNQRVQGSSPCAPTNEIKDLSVFEASETVDPVGLDNVLDNSGRGSARWRDYADDCAIASSDRGTASKLNVHIHGRDRALFPASLIATPDQAESLFL
jgi:hypothetical protein